MSCAPCLRRERRDPHLEGSLTAPADAHLPSWSGSREPHAQRLQLAARRRPPNRFRVRSQELCELLCRVVTLDHAVTCSLPGSIATSAGFVAPIWLISIRASSFGVSNSGQSSRNSFCSLYALRSFSFQ